MLTLVVAQRLQAETLEESRRWAPPTAREFVLLGASEALIAVDVMQTFDMNRHPERRYFEVNPLLGAHPSSARIATMGALGGIGAAALWYALPPRIRWIVPALTIAAESWAIAGNVNAGLSISF